MIETILSQARDRMHKAFDVTKLDLMSIHSGRATPALIENMVISAYEGSQRMKLMEMATITTMDSRTLVISPYDPSAIRDIEKSIQEANVGLTPVIDGEIIRISIPPLSEERRQEYIKLARTKLEAGRIMIRQVRAEAMKDLKNAEANSAISEDERDHGERLVQELTDEMIADIDALGDRKEQDLMQI